MDDPILISNVAKATRQELMEGYRSLLKKYKEQVGIQGAEEQKQIFEKVEQYKSETDINAAINNARGAMQIALGELETKLVAKYGELRQFDEAVAAQKTKLKELYEIESAAGSLMTVLEAGGEAKRKAENEEAETQQKRKRDEEEYKFNLELQKRKDKETFEAEKRGRDTELQAAENLLTEKQTAFSAKEADFANLQKQVAEFPSKLEVEKKQLEEKLKADMEKDKQTSILLLQKESEAQKTVYEGRVKSLETMIEEQKRLIASLQDQLKASQGQVQEVVLKSIEGASGAKTLDVVNRLAMEQSRARDSQR